MSKETASKRPFILVAKESWPALLVQAASAKCSAARSLLQQGIHGVAPIADDSVEEEGTIDTAPPLPGDSHEVLVDASQRQMHVVVRPGAEGLAALMEELSTLADGTPLGCRWTLDLAAVKDANLPFLDGLLIIGRKLQLQAGSLTLTRLCLPEQLAPFRKLFATQCRYRDISLVNCSAKIRKRMRRHIDAAPIGMAAKGTGL